MSTKAIKKACTDKISVCSQYLPPDIEAKTLEEYQQQHSLEKRAWEKI